MPPKPYVEARTPNMTIRNGTFEEVAKAKRGPKGGDPICPQSWGGDTGNLFPHMPRGRVRTQQEDGPLQANAAGALILNFCPPALWERASLAQAAGCVRC